jgi:peptide/nickel transport system permease protein
MPGLLGLEPYWENNAPMISYIARRILISIPVLLLVTIIVFSLLHIVPGDPALQILGEWADPEAVKKLRHQLGLDKPVIVQYLHWLGDIVQGDFGMSLKTRRPVVDEMLERIPVTAQIALASWLVAIIIGLPTGIIAALKRNSLADAAATGFAITGVAMPSFWLGIILIYIVSVWLGWLPTSGFVRPSYDLGKSIELTILPAITGGTGMAAVIMRQVRSSLLEVMRQDYIRTAWAKGLTERLVVIRHALKNALIPVVTIVGLAMGYFLAGSVIIETIFSIPGMGRLAVEAIFQRDYLVVQAVVLLMSVAVIGCNLIVDVLYAYIDPRITYK